MYSLPGYVEKRQKCSFQTHQFKEAACSSG